MPDALDNCVDQMEKDAIIGQRRSLWRSAFTLVANSDGAARIYVDYQAPTLRVDSPIMIRASHRKSHRNGCRGEIQSASYQISVAESEKEKTAFATRRGKWVSTCFFRRQFYSMRLYARLRFRPERLLFSTPSVAVPGDLFVGLISLDRVYTFSA